MMMTEVERERLAKVAQEFDHALEVARQLAEELADAVEELRIHTAEVAAHDDPSR